MARFDELFCRVLGRAARSRTMRSTVCMVAAVALSGFAVAPAGTGGTQRLRGTITIEFPSFDRDGASCKADRFGSVSKLKKGNRVLVYRGVTEGAAVDVGDRPIARGKVGRGTIDDATDECEVAFTVPKAPVLPADEFYVVEVRGISTTQTVSAARVVDGDLGPIPASI